MILKGEDLLQFQVCRILGFCGLPYYSIPNGVNKGIHARWRFSATGLMAGVPDICVPRPYVDRNGVLKHGLYIENKNGKDGKVSPKQQEWMALLQKEGYGVYIVRFIEDVYKLIIECYPEESKRINNINKLTLRTPNVYERAKGTGNTTYQRYKRGF